MRKICNFSKLFEYPSSVYFVDKKIDKRELNLLLKDKKDVSLFFIDGTQIYDSSSLLQSFSRALNFPFVSTNLDSFYDWLRDLSWIKNNRYIIIVFSNCDKLFEHDPKLFSTILKIFDYAIEEWTKTGRQGYILLDRY